MVRIRQANLRDLGLIAPLFDAYRQFYGQRADLPGARRFLRERVRRGESVIFVALAGREAVGFMQLYPLFDSVTMRRMWVLYDLYVVAGWRRRGVGRLLMRWARAWGKQSKAGRLVLETAVGNLPAQRLYEKLGWKHDKEFHRYYLDLK